MLFTHTFLKTLLPFFALSLLLPCSEQEPAPATPPAQQAPLSSPSSPWLLHKAEAEQSNYLPRYLAQVRLEKEYRASEQLSSYLQARGTAASVLGDIREADRLFDEAYGAGRRPVTLLARSPLDDYKPMDAEKFLLQAADRHRVLMLNEGHHQPQTRVLTTRLLRGLYKKGFRYLALETLHSPDDVAESVKRKHPTARMGTYTNEPVFGDLARQAMEIGYTLVPYEFTSGNRANESMMERMNRRESEQARNLKERVFDKDPQAKLLVHAGMGHISEKAQPIDDEKEPWVFMAIRFKEMTGIDPFTVDQQTMLSHSRPEAEPPLYHNAVERGWVKDKAMVFLDKSGNSWTRSNSELTVDAQVFLPPVRFEQERPDWLKRDLNRVAYPIPESLRQASGVRLVQAFFDGEPGNAVPVDQVLVRPNKPVPSLILPKRKGGKFWLRAWDETGKASEPMHIKL